MQRCVHTAPNAPNARALQAHLLSGNSQQVEALPALLNPFTLVSKDAHDSFLGRRHRIGLEMPGTTLFPHENVLGYDPSQLTA